MCNPTLTPLANCKLDPLDSSLGLFVGMQVLPYWPFLDGSAMEYLTFIEVWNASLVLLVEMWIMQPSPLELDGMDLCYDFPST